MPPLKLVSRCFQPDGRYWILTKSCGSGMVKSLKSWNVRKHCWNGTDVGWRGCGNGAARKSLGLEDVDDLVGVEHDEGGGGFC